MKKKQKNQPSVTSYQETDLLHEQIIVGNVSGTGIAIGNNAKATVIQSNIEIDVINDAFKGLYQTLETTPPSAQKDIAQQAVQKLEEEAHKGDKADEGKVTEWFQVLVTMLPDMAEVAITTFINPIQGLNIAFQKIAQKAKDGRASATG